MPSLNHPRIIRIARPAGFRLSRVKPGDTEKMHVERNEAEYLLGEHGRRLAKLQERLYAERQSSVLIVLQGMDTAGKDGVIEHAMSGFNAQGCQVHPFKQPNAEELAHDFLWRAHLRVPQQGHVAVFNRSYYEEVLVVRVHPELLENQKLPPPLKGKGIWRERFASINAFESHLVRHGTLILKFFLHVSKDEQCKRLVDRVDDPEKRWKFSARDLEERKLWPDYMAAYEDMIRNTSTSHAPWHVVPADDKWYARLVVARTIVNALEALDPKFPKFPSRTVRDMIKARRKLMSERRR